MFRAFMPVIYCGGLLFYFLYVSGGSLENVTMLGLGPTLLGLGIIGLIFCIPLAMKLMRLFSGPRAPGPGGRPDAPTRDDEEGFDADAVVARYMAQRSAEAVPNAPAARPVHKGGGPTRPSAFGRRIS
jgi:hypothetical protein